MPLFIINYYVCEIRKTTVVSLNLKMLNIINALMFIAKVQNRPIVSLLVTVIVFDFFEPFKNVIKS